MRKALFIISVLAKILLFPSLAQASIESFNQIIYDNAVIQKQLINEISKQTETMTIEPSIHDDIIANTEEEVIDSSKVEINNCETIEQKILLRKVSRSIYNQSLGAKKRVIECVNLDAG